MQTLLHMLNDYFLWLWRQIPKYSWNKNADRYLLYFLGILSEINLFPSQGSICVFQFLWWNLSWFYTNNGYWIAETLGFAGKLCSTDKCRCIKASSLQRSAWNWARISFWMQMFGVYCILAYRWLVLVSEAQLWQLYYL